MKRIALPAVLLVALSGGLLLAQQAVTQHHHDPHRVAMHMSKKLNLTADQTATVEPIIAAREQKASALKADTTLTPDARQQQMHALHASTETQLAGVLTPDQMTQMKAMHHGHHHPQNSTPATAPPTTQPSV